MGHRVVVSSVPLDVVTGDDVVEQVHAALDEGRGGLLVTPNLDFIRLLQRPELSDIAQAADLLVCDGAPVLWATRLAGTPLPERVTGSDLIWSLSREAAERGRSVAIIGGPPGAAQAALARLVARYPGLRPAGALAPDVGPTVSPTVLAELVTSLQVVEPDIIFVCLGFPKQERLAMGLRQHLPGTWFVGCGAAVEFVAGTRRRAPRWLQRRGLEWVWRLAQEPRRLAPRYARDAAFGIRMLLWSAFRGRRLFRFPGAVHKESDATWSVGQR